MRIVDIAQGSPEWHAHRAAHFNASDAPAMLGCSPYKTRGQLLRERKTGVAQEVDAAAQKRFDDGHRFEALARPWAETKIDDALYPVTVVDGKLSASLDGATLDGMTLYEHKSLNDELRSVITADGSTPGSALPLHYRVQMEQQLLCSGGERVLFVASSWDGDRIIEVRHCWYNSDVALRRQIIDGWAQFALDLEAYEPSEAAPVVTATPVESLPAVFVKMDGQLSVQSNLPAFGAALKAFIEKIPAKPTNDQEFADTDAACKALKKAEDALDAAETNALASMADVETMRRMVADFRDLARKTRLTSEKMVAARKQQIREDEVMRGMNALKAHADALNARLGGRYVLTSGDFPGAIKGLKTLDSVRNAIDTELARAKIEANAIADRIDVNLKAIAAAGEEMAGLFADKMSLVVKESDNLAAIIAQRVAAERERIERVRQQERERLEKQAAEAAAAQQRPVTAAPVVIAPVATSVPPAAPAGPPTLKLGTINERLGFIVTADFLARLGFHATRQKAAALYHEHEFKAICSAIAEHVLKAGGAS